MLTTFAYQFLIFSLATAITSSCIKSRPVKEPISGTKRKDVPAEAEPQLKTMESQPQPAATSMTNESTPVAAKKTPPSTTDCDTSVKFNDEEPIFLPESKVFVTRIMSQCLAPDGKVGHRKNASWMVMGFPCTGGEGRIDWKGTNYNKPKMVSFLLETSCPMAPTDKTKIQKEAFERLGISKEANLVAFNPFVIQYWEIPSYGDADTSFAVDLRSNKGLDEGWANFIKPKPMRIFLVGRENAWVPGNFMYAVEGDLHWVNKNRFTFKVEKARLLGTDELLNVKTRCEALKPPRDCSRVF
jgi:hypothetical protein